MADPTAPSTPTSHITAEWPPVRPLLGCDYNPEQWPREVWDEDVALMREAGISLVAINIFGWAEIERGPDQWHFEDLDHVMNLLHDNGIGVNLGTGTSSPPPWLTTRHPEILPVAADDTTRWPGGRQAWCPSSSVFLNHALKVVEHVAQRYSQHPALRMWHVSNELGCHNALCYCDESARAFREWLRGRYADIDELNRAWGTSFWSQRYQDFAEILPPRLTLSSPNPTQVLDYRRFSSDELLSYYRAETEVLRRHSSVPVTTNLMVTHHQQDADYWDWAPHLDIIANDHYLDHRLPDTAAELAFCADLTRGLAEGGPWLLMEHSTGAVNWQSVNLAKAPGEMLRNSLSHLARGADGLCFFQWRASRQGAEKFHSAMLPHAGTDSAIWREVLELSRVLELLPEVTGSVVSADVAMLFSFENSWAANAPNRPSDDVVHQDQVLHTYHALRAAGVTVDLVRPGTRLDDYKLVVVPHLYLVRDEEAAVVHDFVRAGGHAVVTFFSGIVDEDDRVRDGAYPCAFRDLLGISVDEVFPLATGTELALRDGGSARRWSERITLNGAKAEYLLAEGPLAGHPAVTSHDYGQGRTWYVGTELDPATYHELISAVLDRAAIQPEPGASAEVEVIRRAPAAGTMGPAHLFVINHGSDPVHIPATGHEVVTDQSVADLVEVPAGAVRIVRYDMDR